MFGANLTPSASLCLSYLAYQDWRTTTPSSPALHLMSHPAVLGNGALILVVLNECTLHELCMSSYPCVALTSCCPPPLCPRLLLSSGSMLGRLPLILHHSDVFIHFAFVTESESFWPLHLTATWQPFVLL